MSKIRAFIGATLSTALSLSFVATDHNLAIGFMAIAILCIGLWLYKLSRDIYLISHVPKTPQKVNKPQDVHQLFVPKSIDK